MEQSNDQGRFLLIKILDPGRKRFYRRCVCDCSLEFKLWWTDTGLLQPSGFSTEFASGHYEYTVQVKCSYCYWRHSNACCSQLCWCSGNEPNGQTGSRSSLQLIHTWQHFCVWLCFHVYDCTCWRTGQIYLWFMRRPYGNVLISFSCCTGISPPHGE